MIVSSFKANHLLISSPKRSLYVIYTSPFQEAKKSQPNHKLKTKAIKKIKRNGKSF